MKGNIYAREKCLICGGKLLHDERRSGCFCVEHPQVAATRGFIVKYGRKLRQEKSTYQEAARLLTGWRFKDDEGQLDPRDYRADAPMAFSKLVTEYLEEKRGRKSFRDIKRFMIHAAEYWGNVNVKTIRKPDIKRWLKSIKAGDKTRDNYRAQLHNFFQYLVDEEILTKNQFPDFPVIDYELGWRTVINWEDQQAVLDKLWEMSGHINPKIYFGIELLRTYTNLRPGDLRKLTEGDADAKNGILTFWYPTKKKNQRKTVRLIPDHIEVLRSLKQKYPALPSMKFFRHTSSQGGVKKNSPVGENYFYRWWCNACDAVEVKGVDLYGGTRHTTTTELAKLVGRDGAKEASGHETNKAFDRYCQMQGDRAYQMSQMVHRQINPPARKRKIN